MWPKMLFELLPHVGRVIPMAEKFFATRGAREQEQQAQLAAITETLRTELGKAAEVNSGLERAFNEQGKQVDAVAADVSAVAADVKQAKTSLDLLSRRMAGLEDKIAGVNVPAQGLRVMLSIVFALLCLVFGLLVYVAGLVRVGR